MKITVHRGTNQIGGCITEIESGGGYKVFIDFGEELPGTVNSKQLPKIEGLTCGDVSKSALFITHYHGDHIGKIAEAVFNLPVYIGETALKIYECLERRLSFLKKPEEKKKHKKILEKLKAIKTFNALDKIEKGGITVTPLFVDHSAFDAHMFIIEADGKRILHTGDFRGHGFRSKGLFKMLKYYAQDIDYIISEGSNINRYNSGCQTEQDLKKKYKEKFKEKKYNFIFVSSTNIDRLFALYHSAKDARRCFVCDDYQTKILKIVSQAQKQYDFYDIDYEQKKNYAGRFFELNRKPYIFYGELKRYLDDHGFCMLIRANDDFKTVLDEYYNSNETKIYYSMWKGYLKKTNPAYNPQIADYLKQYKYEELEYMHTSGHADTETLKRVFDTVKPKCGIIPIHTESPKKFKEEFKGYKVILLDDGSGYNC